jgi:hypothetical protein
MARSGAACLASKWSQSAAAKVILDLFVLVDAEGIRLRMFAYAFMMHACSCNPSE